MLIEKLSEELQEKAKNELNEIPSEVENNLKHIRDWLKKQPYSNIARTDDLWLLNFLRGCKFSLQKTKEKLDYFHQVRYTAPNFYCNRDPLSADIQDLLKSGLFLPITGKNNVSIIVNWKNADPKKIPMELILRASCMLLEIYINENIFCMITGFHIIIDYTHFSFGYIPQLSLDFIKKMISTIQNAHPLRLRGVHFINVPQYLEIILSLAKPLLSKHLEKLSLYRENNFEDIFNYVPKEMIPIEYEGDGETIESIIEKTKTKMESYRNWFIEDEQRFSNYQMISSKTKPTQQIHESFRKLGID